MISLVLALSIACVQAFRFAPANVASGIRLSMNDQFSRSSPIAPPGYKPMADGSYKKAGDFLDEYLLEINNGAFAKIRTYGGNCFTYITKDGIEVMGTRGDAVLDDSKPYAGGAPHCFPQFGPGPLIQHGFARGMKFVPEERAKKLSFDRMIFKLVPTEETRKVWDYDFEYRFDITLREDCLEWDVIIKNEGDKPFDVTLGFHNYFDVSSLKNVKIEGPFKGKATLDRQNGDVEGTCDTDVLTITEPVDMLYRDVTGPISIVDSGKGTRTTIEGKGFTDRCIWSPFGNEAQHYDKFICIEPVQVSTPVNIPVGKLKETSFYQKVSCTKL